MTAYNIGRSAGLAFGIAFGLVIVVIIMKIVNKNKKMKTEYDEMQNQIRGKAFKYGFYAALIAEAVFIILSAGITLPVEPIVTHFFVIFAAVMVESGYCIWKGAYIGLNTNLRRYVIIMILVSLFNLFVAFMAWKHGNMVVDGILQAPFVNFLCGIIFAILGAEMLIKKAVDREAE